MMITIRKLVPEDSVQLLHLQHQLDEESSFMLLEPDERQSGLQQVREMIENFMMAETSVLVGAEVDGGLVGFISLRGGTVRRNRHSAYVVIGILKQYQGVGIGTALFHEMDEWALEHQVIRLELTVMTHNDRALALYVKSGFAIEGTRVKSLKVNGQWVDEYYMGKIIE
ncbi:GNAT family N-acetyltransferase [Paenibacillus wynnii]|uniref:GNAT family N-acetyltransferase n=1 Tax=Paenibacillus wynnii TaxID=268407 RepID=UPI00279222F5|nr:GNAT family protein [Paenibacillus wynnii]MDQ0195030.1 RimJ/RimL family protein N-acetyltransferase [Paenibacillus wynnii]